MDRWSIDHLLIGERMLSDHLVSDDSVLSVEEALPAKMAVAEQIAEKVEALTSSNVRRNYIAHRSHELYTFLHVRWHHKHVFFRRNDILFAKNNRLFRLNVRWLNALDSQFAKFL